MNELKQIVQTNDLDKKDGQIIIDRFGSYEDTAREWESKAQAIVVTSRDQTTEMAMAREARKKFSNMRIELEKARKAIGEPAFRKYKAVNAVANYLQALIKPIEDHLREQEEFIKRDDARIEAEKKIEAERKAEAERLAKEEAERKEQERIRKENERLKKEAEAKEKQLEKEREEARKREEAKEKALQAEREKARKAAEAQAKALQDQKDKAKAKEDAIKAKAQAEADKLKAKAKREADARAKIEARLKQQREEAVAKEREQARREQEALRAPDVEKFKAYVHALQSVKAPVLKDKELQNRIETIIIYLANL